MDKKLNADTIAPGAEIASDKVRVAEEPKAWPYKALDMSLVKGPEELIFPNRYGMMYTGIATAAIGLLLLLLSGAWLMLAAGAILFVCGWIFAENWYDEDSYFLYCPLVLGAALTVIGLILWLVTGKWMTFALGIVLLIMTGLLVVYEFYGDAVRADLIRLDDEPEEERFFSFSCFGDECSIANYTGRSRVVKIPDTLNKLDVIALEGGFSGRRNLFSIDLPVHLETISDGAFRSCVNLQRACLSDKLTALPRSCFEGCRKLPMLVLPVSVTEIGERAFAGCAGLRDVYITSATTHIAQDAFDGCGKLLFHVQRGSEAERFAKTHSFDYSYK